jgi:hypothetical protein
MGQVVEYDPDILTIEHGTVRMSIGRKKEDSGSGKSYGEKYNPYYDESGYFTTGGSDGGRNGNRNGR